MAITLNRTIVPAHVNEAAAPIIRAALRPGHSHVQPARPNPCDSKRTQRDPKPSSASLLMNAESSAVLMRGDADGPLEQPAKGACVLIPHAVHDLIEAQPRSFQQAPGSLDAGLLEELKRGLPGCCLEAPDERSGGDPEPIGQSFQLRRSPEVRHEDRLRAQYQFVAMMDLLLQVCVRQLCRSVDVDEHHPRTRQGRAWSKEFRQ